jgi:magnesium transporter
MATVIPNTQADAGPRPRVRVVARNSAGAVEFELPVERIAEAIADPETTVWVDVQAPDGDQASVEALFRDVFHFHPLAIDDALTETHVPKLDDWGQYLYVVIHALDFDKATDEMRLHEVDIFLGPNYLVSYHSDPVTALDQLRKNLERDSERLKQGADHILYYVLDMIVADYLGVIEHLDELIDDAQDEVFDRPTPRTLQRIFWVKRAAMRIHRLIAPQREVLNRLARDPYAMIDEADRVYFRDVYDHLVRLHDITESLRDLIASALDTYLSAISNRTNEIMKVLTVVSIMFLPMTFLAGFFGMNFFGEPLMLKTHLPEGLIFSFTCLVMVGTPVAMGLWMKYRGWF